jgi:uncharacterized membrane protein
MSDCFEIAGRILMRSFAALTLAAVAMAAVVGIYTIVVEPYGDVPLQLISSAVIVAGFSGLSVAASVLVRRRRLLPLLGLGILCCAGAAINWSYMIFNARNLDYSQVDLFARLGFSLTATAIGLIYTVAMANLKTKSSLLGWLRWATVTLAWCWGAAVLPVMWYAEQFEEIFPVHVLMFISMILTMVGAFILLLSLLVPMLVRLHARREKQQAESVSKRVRLTMTCPACRCELTVPTGPARCGQCGHTMIIEIEEPRCECGYLLYQLVGEVCPECGRMVPKKLRWSGAGAAG